MTIWPCLPTQSRRSTSGRFNAYNLWPFSLAELAAHTSWIEVKRQMHERMIYGCTPAVINEPQHAQQYLLDFADAVLYKDLFKLAEMRKPSSSRSSLRFRATRNRKSSSAKRSIFTTTAFAMRSSGIFLLCQQEPMWARFGRIYFLLSA